VRERGKGVRVRRQREEEHGGGEERVYKHMLSQGQGVKGKRTCCITYNQ